MKDKRCTFSWETAKGGRPLTWVIFQDGPNGPRSQKFPDEQREEMIRLAERWNLEVMADDEQSLDLYWHALNYRTAAPQHAQAMWEELEACVERMLTEREDKVRAANQAG